MPQDRAGRFSTEPVRALPAVGEGAGGPASRDVRAGVSTRVKAVTEVLCGTASASSISQINKSLDENLKAFAERRPSEPIRT